MPPSASDLSEDPPPPPSRDPSDRQAGRTPNYFTSIANSCSRSWNCIKDGCARAWIWFSSKTSSCCVNNKSKCDSDSTSSKRRARNNLAAKKTQTSLTRPNQPVVVRSNEHSPPARLKANSTERLIPKRRLSKESKDGNKMAEQPSHPPPTATKHAEHQRPAPVNSTSEHSTSVASKTIGSHRTVGSDAAADTKSTISLEPPLPQSPPPPPPKPEPKPPRIEFVETGSIFGGRRRTSHSNLLLLDDGRFRSPGSPNVTTTPNGRPIRISFQTGFPSFKSIESRASLSPISSQAARSVDSEGQKRQQQHHHQETVEEERHTAHSSHDQAPQGADSRSAGSSGFQAKAQRTRRTRTIKSTYSRKSVKSYKSRSSREQEAPEDIDPVDELNDDENQTVDE